MKTAIFYILSLVAAVAVFLFVRNLGQTLTAPSPVEQAAVASASSPDTNVLPHLLLALAAVVGVGRLLGTVFRRIGQPPVIGEVVGGILLGPSLLGLISPAASAFILPPTVAPFLGLVAQLGIIIYMFLVGLELNVEVLRSRLKATIAISHASILAPFVLGAALALYIYPRFSTTAVPFTSFALFLGLAMSITAFPVLARILSDLELTRTELGTIALTCAAIDDVTAWCLLAFVVGVVNSSAGGGMLVAALTVAFVGVMFGVVRPMIAALVARLENQLPSQGAMALTLVGLLVSAWITEAIGIHAIFGAFLFGAVVPHQSRLAQTLRQNLELLTLLLLPAFFAFTGMRTEIGLITSAYGWIVCILIIAVATIGKFGGTLLAARMTGIGTLDASRLGILMNTRGLMELVVLNVGLDLGVISPTLFTMMVLMALVTTLATTPVLHLLATGPLTHSPVVPTMTPPK